MWNLPELPVYKAQLSFEQFASRVGVAGGYLGYLRQILLGGQVSGVQLSTSTVEILEVILASRYVYATTDAEVERIESSVAELKILFEHGNRPLWDKFSAMSKDGFDSIVKEVISTLKAAGWRLVRRHDSDNAVGTSIYLSYTTDGKPPDPDYQWDIRRSPELYESYEPLYDEYLGDSPETFRFDPRHCKVRISGHGGGYSDIGVSIVVSLGSASCKILDGRPREFDPGRFGWIFDRYIKPEFSPSGEK